ncbi:MAG: hypothetical protein ABL962_01315 [Fimbriimonadaceae bacterium]
MKQVGPIAWVAIVFSLLTCFAIGVVIYEGTKPAIPEVVAFLSHHPEFGRIASKQQAKDWTYGQRQKVTFNDGKTYTFVTKGGMVAEVLEDRLGPDPIVWQVGKGYIVEDPAAITEIRRLSTRSWTGVPASATLKDVIAYSKRGSQMAALITDAKATKLTAEQTAIVADFYASIKTQQEYLYPALRIAFGKAATKHLDEMDCTVTTFGPSNSGLRLVGRSKAGDDALRHFTATYKGAIIELRFVHLETLYFGKRGHITANLGPARDREIIMADGKTVASP